MLTVGSLFSGIGGFDLGLERAGMRTAWFCEQDDFCRYVLAQHWPGVPCHPDITDLRGAEVERVDVLCGGFPCQDLSLAGSGAGLAGARSGLWSEYARLVGELGPRYVVVENVSALLARGLGAVLADLAALGYDAEWDCIPASAVGAPHRRDRIWLVAYPQCHDGGQGRSGRPTTSGPGKPEPVGSLRVADAQGTGLEGSGLRGRPSVRGEDVADADQERRRGWPRQLGTGRRPELADGRSELVDEGWPVDDSMRGRHGPPQGPVRPGRHGALDADWWAAEPDVGRVAHGVPARVDRLRSLGNALVPQIAEWIGGRIIDYERNGGRA